MSEQINDYNLFMVCRRVNKEAFRGLPEGFSIDHCRPEELEIWKEIHFDQDADKRRFRGFMNEYFAKVYAPRGDEFYRRCLFVRNSDGWPVGTGFLWNSYGCANTLHWMKIRLEYENQGLGRALLTRMLSELSEDELPVHLHTQPESYRAIKLYSDFGFDMVTDARIGGHDNHLRGCLPYLRNHMPEREFANLRFAPADEVFVQAAAQSAFDEF